ncbi:type VI secretion system secreted protein VgrG [Paraburkholderia phenazinium]|uniref:Type VI secretion system secreted protein VgrG n=1 Tax=Paraburkholderia phenazinium TaxID=60549 RepID=A0A1G7PL62_9BURK|nr:type VI secretion system Vgr family protein [Paraburkholderia phenazinium]SDF86884.1 type VI secretion system secreted protein VgrG [Paraburkholderia phenazinium]
MSYSAIQRVFIGALPSQDSRPFRLYWRSSQKDLAGLLLIQRLDIREDLCGGIEGRLSCISTSVGVPLQTFLGQPLTVQLVTDQGALHSICAIVTDAHEGESDGSVATYQLVIRDALLIMERRINTRIFRTKSVVDIIQTLVREWRRKSTTLGGTFDLDVSNLDISKYPVREQTLQFDESDADFIRRLCRRDGIAWFVRAGGGQGNTDATTQPFHTLVLFDNVIKLGQADAGTVRYHADATVGARDSITLLSTGRQLVAGSIRRASWDLKPSRVDQVQAPTRVDQGSAGNDLATLLSDARIDSPHMADSWGDYDRIGIARLMAHGARSARIDGASGVRNLQVGFWIGVSGHPELDQLPAQQRRIVITALHHTGENNLPKDLNERAQALFTASRWQFATPPVSVDTSTRPTAFDGSSQSRYENTFSAVAQGTPLTPSYDPRIDLPRVYPITGKVTATEGEEVYCDQYGRINVQLQGLDPADHEHANGAGTAGTPADSAAVRVLSGWSGDNFGSHAIPRAGMEVLLDFANGDPDRMYVAGVFSNGDNMPATFSRTGSLPGNRYLSGLRSREIKGERYNQLRLDDTPSQISAQLTSEHAFSELNLGYLTKPRENGQGANRGEGAELRTDAAAALRAAQGILLTTYARTQASGNQLDRDELVQLLGECTELFKSLGDYAGQHGGQSTDAVGQSAVASAFKSWSTGGDSAGTGNSTATGSHALMAIGAQAGSVNVTPKTHVTYAGENIDQVAQQHLQLVSGQRWVGLAGQGMQLFAMANGISAIANQGDLQLQAQAGDVVIQAQKDLHLSATKDVYISGQKIHIVSADGSYYTIGGGHEIGSNGRLTVKTAGHSFNGPSTQQSTPPNFGKDGTKQRYQLHYPGHTEDSPMLAANQAYKITMNDGRVIQGTSDSKGLTDLLQDDVMRIARIDVLKPQL